MAKYTENIRLAQPEGSDYYDIEVFNHNSELIDKKIGEMDNSLSTIKEGATREKAGIVQLGTEEGKALEGMMLARLAGAYGYGGDIQDEGVKNPNYIYYDRNTRKMYKCLKQNQDISANVANFIPLDNNSLLERLENLFSLNLIRSSQNKGYKFYVKASERTNYIDVSDTFLSVDFCIVSPYKEGISSNDARIVNFQEFKEGKILINSVWVKNGSIETKYSPNSSDSIITTSCIAFVYGTLK